MPSPVVMASLLHKRRLVLAWPVKEGRAGPWHKTGKRVEQLQRQHKRRHQVNSKAFIESLGAHQSLNAMRTTPLSAAI